MDSESLARLFETIEREQVNLHGVVIMRNGHIVAEAYAAPYGQDTRHNLYSCTKSVTAALVGIAIDKGTIETVDQRVLDLLPDRAVENPDPRKDGMTLAHLLTMTSGLDWPESSVSYASSENILMQMLRSRDWTQFILDRPMAADPGVAFNYSTGNSHLISAVIHEATGTSLKKFAQIHLFQPLGISNVSWSSGPEGVTFGGGGLWMTPRDLAKFGQLYLQSGAWNGQQIIPADWVDADVSRQTSASGAASYYGYGWWVRADGIYAAYGYKGQRLFVVPDHEMVVVFTADLSGSAPVTLLNATIIPAVKSDEPLPEDPAGVARLKAAIAQFEQ